MPNATYRPAWTLSLRMWRTGLSTCRARSSFTMTRRCACIRRSPALDQSMEGPRCTSLAMIRTADGVTHAGLPPRKVCSRRWAPLSCARGEGVVRIAKNWCDFVHFPRSVVFLRSPFHSDLDTYEALVSELNINNRADYDTNVSVPFEFYTLLEGWCSQCLQDVSVVHPSTCTARSHRRL